jgi:hypothetical protein
MEERREKLLRQPLEKAEEAKADAAELQARLAAAQEEANERAKDSASVSGRDRINAQIRVEMLTAQTEANRSTSGWEPRSRR